MKLLPSIRLFTLLAMFLVPAWGKGQTIAAGQTFELVISGVTRDDATPIDGKYRVDQFGVMQLPLVGEVKAMGLTVSQLADKIDAAYRSHGFHPTSKPQLISGCSSQTTAKSVAVGGYVHQPGWVKLLPRMTLLQAVQSAGGGNEFAALSRVRFMRNGKIREYDLTRAEGQNVPLEEGDVIEVPQRVWMTR